MTEIDEIKATYAAHFLKQTITEMRREYPKSHPYYHITPVKEPAITDPANGRYFDFYA